MFKWFVGINYKAKSKCILDYLDSQVVLFVGEQVMDLWNVHPDYELNLQLACELEPVTREEI